MESKLTTLTTNATAQQADAAASSSYSPEDEHEFTVVIHGLVRLASHQGQAAVEEAVKEAGRLDRRFCATCGQETAHEGRLCVECGRVTTPATDVEEAHSD